MGVVAICDWQTPQRGGEQSLHLSLQPLTKSAKGKSQPAQRLLSRRRRRRILEEEKRNCSSAVPKGNKRATPTPPVQPPEAAACVCVTTATRGAQGHCAIDRAFASPSGSPPAYLVTYMYYTTLYYTRGVAFYYYYLSSCSRKFHHTHTLRPLRLYGASSKRSRPEREKSSDPVLQPCTLPNRAVGDFYHRGAAPPQCPAAERAAYRQYFYILCAS